MTSRPFAIGQTVIAQSIPGPLRILAISPVINGHQWATVAHGNGRATDIGVGSLTHPLTIGQHASGPDGTTGRITDIRHAGAHETWTSTIALCPSCYVTISWNRGNTDCGQAIHHARDITRVGGLATPGDVITITGRRGPWIVTGARLYANSADGPGYHRELHVVGVNGPTDVYDGDDVTIAHGLTVDDARRWHDDHR